MGILLLGLNHRTAPVEVREQLAFSRDGAGNALALFRRMFPDAEAAILSTCNRVEIVVSADDGSPGVDDVVAFLAQARNIPADVFADHLYRKADGAAIQHVLRVIAGLDSMVLGESQIVSQMKQAYTMAHEQGTAGPVLHRLFHHAFGVSKRIRSETEIGEGKLSVSSVAVDLIREVCPDPSEVTVLVVGAGEMAQYACQYLAEEGVKRLCITTRTLSNAKALADAVGGQAVPYAQLDRYLVEADVVITATSCPAAILTVERVARAQQARVDEPLLLVDLAVPRNIDPGVSGIEGVKLYDIDALGEVVSETHRNRLAQLGACEQIVDEEVEAFEKWIGEARVRPIIDQIYRDVRELASVEVRRTMNRCPDLTDEQKDEVQQLVDRLIGKFLHPCVATIRAQSHTTTSTQLAEGFRSLRLTFEGRQGLGAEQSQVQTENRG